LNVSELAVSGLYMSEARSIVCAPSRTPSSMIGQLNFGIAALTSSAAPVSLSAPGPSRARSGSKLGTPMISIRFISRSAW